MRSRRRFGHGSNLHVGRSREMTAVIGAIKLPTNAAKCTPVRANARDCCSSVLVLMWR